MTSSPTAGLLRYVEQPAVRSQGVAQPPAASLAEGQAVAWLDWLLRHRERSPRTVETYETTLTAWFGWCDTHNLDPLFPTLADLEAFTVRPTRHGGQRSTSTRQLDITALRCWFGWMHQRGQVRVNPAAELEPPREKRRQARPIPDDHWLSLWDAATSTELRVALALGYYCGVRREEMTMLHGSQVTPELLTAFVRKGGHEHTLPWREMVELHAQHPRLAHVVTADVADLLTSQARARGSQLLLWARGKTIHSKMVALCARAGVPHYTPHQLRHSCATNLVNRAAVPIQIVQELLNHATLNTTRVYVRVGGGALREWRHNALGERQE